MKIAQLAGLRRFEIAQVPDPSPAPDQVLIAVQAIGICASDLHYWNEGRIGNQIMDFPKILGHESAGVVLELGSAVHGLKVGDTVAIDPAEPCGRCRLCLMGRQNCCTDMRFLGSPERAGAHQQYLAVRAEHCLKLPEGFSAAHGAFIEPLSVSLHAIRQSNFKMGQSAVVIGCGTIGLGIAACLLHAGVSRLILVERHPARLSRARALGWAEVLDPGMPGFLEILKDLTDGHGVEVAFEAGGTPESFRCAFECAAVGGSVVLVGICELDDIPLPMHIARRKELVIYLSRRDNREYPVVLDLAKRGIFDMDSLISGTEPIDRVQEAFVAAHEKHAGVLKTMLTFAEN